MKTASIHVLLLVALNSYCQTYDVDHLNASRNISSISIIENNVWLGTNLGMYKVNKSDLSYERIDDVFIENNADYCYRTKVRKDAFGRIFVYSSNKVFQYKNDQLIKIEDDLYSERFDIDENGIKWMVSQNYNGELIKWKNGVRTAYPIPYNMGIFSIFAATSAVYLGTQLDGILRFKNGVFSFINSNNSELPRTSVGQISSDGQGYLAVSCYNIDYSSPINDRTIGVLKNGKWTSTNSNSIFTENAIHNQLYSYDGVLYAATDEGLGVYKDDSWELITSTSHNIASNSVLSVARDGEDLWIGTSKGLTLIRNGETINITFSREVPQSNTDEIEKDSNGDLWISTFCAGLYKQNSDDWIHIKFNDSSVPSYYVEIDNNDIVWTTNLTSDKVYRVENLVVSEFQIPNNEISGNTRNIITDSNGNLWVHKDNALFTYNNSVWTSYNANDHFMLNEIEAIEADNLGNVWVASGNQGLVKFDGLNWTNYDASTFGEDYAIIYSIYPDENGMLWLELNNYLSRKMVKFDPSTLDYNVEFYELSERVHGLLHVENDGTFWYNSIDGFAKYKNNIVTSFGRENGFLTPSFKYMEVDDSENIWLSSYGCHTTRFREGVLFDNPTDPDLETGATLIYPNPTETGILIKPSDQFTSPVTIDVYDLNGKPLLNLTGNIGFEIIVGLEQFKNGIYLVRISNLDHSEIHRVAKN